MQIVVALSQREILIGGVSLFLLLILAAAIVACFVITRIPPDRK